MLFGKKHQAPHKRRQQAHSGKSCLCGARLATFSDKSRRRAHISGKGRWGRSLPLPAAPRVPPAALRATFAGAATAASVPGRALSVPPCQARLLVVGAGVSPRSGGCFTSLHAQLRQAHQRLPPPAGRSRSPHFPGGMRPFHLGAGSGEHRPSAEP